MTADLLRPWGDPLEADLLTLFAAQPSAAAMGRLDERMEGRLRAWDPLAGRRSRGRTGRRAGLIGLLAAALVVGGATGNLQALYLVVAGPFDLPWHRGEAIGQSQVVDGYRVTIDRAYADATRLALAISVVDEHRRPGTTQVMAMSTVVTDAGGEYGGFGATSSPDGAFAAVNVAWKVPATLPLPSGPRAFKVVVPFIMVRDDASPPPNADAIEWTPWRRHAGPWTFEFELDVDGGTTMLPDAVADVDGVTVRVTRVIAASDIVRVEARVEGAPEDDVWAPVGTITHGGLSARFVMSSFEDDGSVALVTDGGLGDELGAWTITFDDLVGGAGNLSGPWVLSFDGP
jgi:hypothetical protein